MFVIAGVAEHFVRDECHSFWEEATCLDEMGWIRIVIYLQDSH